MRLMLEIQKLMKTERITSALCGEMTDWSVRRTKRDVVQNSSVLLV